MSDTNTAGPSGLGGWLVLVGLGLVVGPLRLAYLLLQTFVPIFFDGTWEVITTPGSEAYHPLWGPLIIFEVVGNAAFVAAGVWLLVLFFKQAAAFPSAYVWVALVNPIFIALDAWFGSFVLTEEPMFDAATATEMGRSLVGALIWVPYMVLSKRVKNTFVAPAGAPRRVVA